MTVRHLMATTVLLPLLLSCGGESDSAAKVGEVALEMSTDTSVLSSIENPIQPGTSIDTKGWSGLVVDVLGRVTPEVAAIYDSDYDPSFDYVLVGFRGTNARGKLSNIYKMVWSCEPSGSVGSDGVFRKVLIGGEYKNGLSGIRLVSSGDDEVLDGFEDIGAAIYKVKAGDSSAFVMSQSRHCGYELDLVVALGDVSKLEFVS